MTKQPKEEMQQALGRQTENWVPTTMLGTTPTMLGTTLTMVINHDWSGCCVPNMQKRFIPDCDIWPVDFVVCAAAATTPCIGVGE